MHLVPHRGEKLLCEWMAGVIIHAGCVDVGDLLVKAPLAVADVLQAAGQLVEIIPALAGVLQTLVLQHETLDEILLQLVIGPLAETHPHLAAHPKAQSQYHVQVVVSNLILFAVSGSCSEYPNNCIFIQFAIFKDVLDVLTDRALSLAEQLGKLLLVQPQGFGVQHHVDFGTSILALVKLEVVHFKS